MEGLPASGYTIRLLAPSGTPEVAPAYSDAAIGTHPAGNVFPRASPEWEITGKTRRLCRQVFSYRTTTGTPTVSVRPSERFTSPSAGSAALRPLPAKSSAGKVTRHRQAPGTRIAL